MYFTPSNLMFFVLYQTNIHFHGIMLIKPIMLFNYLTKFLKDFWTISRLKILSSSSCCCIKFHPLFDVLDHANSVKKHQASVKHIRD